MAANKDKKELMGMFSTSGKKSEDKDSPKKETTKEEPKKKKSSSWGSPKKGQKVVEETDKGRQTEETMESLIPKVEVKEEEVIQPAETVKEIVNPKKVTIKKQEPKRASSTFIKPLSSEEDEYDFSPEETSKKVIIAIAGEKGKGKTFCACSFVEKGESMAIITFDHKSGKIKELFFPNKNITVYDGMRYATRTPATEYVKTSLKNLKYLVALLKKLDGVDWIVLDGMDVVKELAEMVMRNKHNLMPFQGISNRNVWKERRLAIAEIFYSGLGSCIRGLITTMYVNNFIPPEDIEDPTIIAEKQPKWVDIVMQETDTVVVVEAVPVSGQKTTLNQYIAYVKSSKDPNIREGVYDISGIKHWSEAKRRQS